MKKCKKCGVIKLLNKFYKHKKMKDKYRNECKECMKARIKEYRKNNIKKYKIYNKQWKKENVEKIERYSKQYYKKNKKTINIKGKKWKKNNRDKIQKYEKRYNQTENQKLRHRVYMEIYNAIKLGKLKRQPCEVCGAKKVEAHHPNYNEPLEIKWLCRKCHLEWHKNNKTINLFN